MVQRNGVQANPWGDLPSGPLFVLPNDAEPIRRFNEGLEEISDPERRETQLRNFLVHLEQLPEPFIGAPRAPVVLLAIHPGFDESEHELHADSDFAGAIRDNLLHRPMDYPFYYLDPRFSDSAGTVWWKKTLKPLLQKFGQETLARQIFCVEHFPYHCRHSKDRVVVPSQRYGFGLVDMAMRRRAIIVIIGGKRLWWDSLRNALHEYPHCYWLNSTQNPQISHHNCPDGFPKIVEALNLPPEAGV